MSEHNHSHSPVISTLSRAFIVAIVLNMLFVLVEAGVGMYIHSLALIADAGHNLSDVASLGLSLFAFRLSRTKPTTIFSYGYQKTTILAAMINATVLLIAIGIIGWEAIQHFLAPQPIYGGAVVIVAGIGVVINGMTAYFFHSNKENDLNAKGA